MENIDKKFKPKFKLFRFCVYLLLFIFSIYATLRGGNIFLYFFLSTFSSYLFTRVIEKHKEELAKFDSFKHLLIKSVPNDEQKTHVLAKLHKKIKEYTYYQNRYSADEEYRKALEDKILDEENVEVKAFFELTAYPKDINELKRAIKTIENLEEKIEMQKLDKEEVELLNALIISENHFIEMICDYDFY